MGQIPRSTERISSLNSILHKTIESNTRTNFPYMYTVNHKKRDILFLTVTLSNLNRFL